MPSAFLVVGYPSCGIPFYDITSYKVSLDKLLLQEECPGGGGCLLVDPGAGASVKPSSAGEMRGLHDEMATQRQLLLPDTLKHAANVRGRVRPSASFMNYIPLP